MSISENTRAKVRRVLFLTAGFLCIALGTIGIVLPLLPTTPFYLLAAFCLAKGSARFHSWFTNTRLYKKHMESFATNRSLTIEAKLGILLPVTALLAVSFIFMNIVILRAIIVILALVKWWYFIRVIRTIKASEKGIESYAKSDNSELS